MELNFLKFTNLGFPQLNSVEKILIELSCSKISSSTETEVKFWGKVAAIDGDYYIISSKKSSWNEQEKGPTFYYSFDCMDFNELPVADKLFSNGSNRHQFHGKSFSPFEGKKLKESDKKKHIDEIQRLANVISHIDNDTSAVPIKVVQELRILNNQSLLPVIAFDDVSKLENWVHQREPQIVSNILESGRGPLEGWDKLSEDLPKTSWAIRVDPLNFCVTLQSLMWPGYVAFCIPKLNQIGSFYFGNGECCNDLPFLL